LGRKVHERRALSFVEAERLENTLRVFARSSGHVRLLKFLKECERVKASKKQQLKEAADVRQEMQQEMERMR